LEVEVGVTKKNLRGVGGNGKDVVWESSVEEFKPAICVMFSQICISEISLKACAEEVKKRGHMS